MDEVQDEAAEGVWGYLIPLDDKVRESLVLRKRDSCDSRRNSDSRTKFKKEAEQSKIPTDKQSRHPGGFLVGRHPECGT